MVCKISNFDMRTAKHLAQGSCTELTLMWVGGWASIISTNFIAINFQRFSLMVIFFYLPNPHYVAIKVQCRKGGQFLSFIVIM